MPELRQSTFLRSSEKSRAAGRAPAIRNYTWWRRAWEDLWDLVMPTDWPADLAAACWNQPVERIEIEVTVAKPLGSARQLRVGFASDFHAGPLTPPEVIQRAIDRLNEAAPDVILLGGDFVTFRSYYIDRLIEPLRQLRPPLGVFAVLGNHDHWTGADEVRAALPAAGVQMLDNASVRLPSPFENVRLVGIDDHFSGRPDASVVEWCADAVTILNMHEPSGLLDVGDRHFDVALAGHTHGGQIVLPLIGAPISPSGELSRRYIAGRYSVGGGRELMVSRGVGNGGFLPIRYGAPSDIVIATVRGC
jgi:predicted MPP superfamily phosphohydrolase